MYIFMHAHIHAHMDSGRSPLALRGRGPGTSGRMYSYILAYTHMSTCTYRDMHIYTHIHAQMARVYVERGRLGVDCGGANVDQRIYVQIVCTNMRMDTRTHARTHTHTSVHTTGRTRAFAGRQWRRQCRSGSASVVGVLAARAASSANPSRLTDLPAPDVCMCVCVCVRVHM